MRHILGITDEERQQRREQVLATKLQDFRCAYSSLNLCLIPIIDCGGCADLSI